MEIKFEDVTGEQDNSLKNIYFHTQRAKVFGGWIIKEVLLLNDENKDNWKDAKISMVFIPDQKHDWGFDMMDGVL